MVTNLLLFALAAFCCYRNFLADRKIAAMKQMLLHSKISFQSCEDFAYPEKDGAEILKICQTAVEMIEPFIKEDRPQRSSTGGEFLKVEVIIQ